ncbi:MAG: class I SAM-dependent methyltransferase [Candidatus Binatia bacterium]
MRRLSDHFEAYGYDASAEARNGCWPTAPDAVVLEEWESPVGHFDVIVALHALEHLPQPRPVVESLTRHLAPGGLLLFVAPNPSGLGHRIKGRRWFAYPRTTTPGTGWRATASRCGSTPAWCGGCAPGAAACSISAAAPATCCAG